MREAPLVKSPAVSHPSALHSTARWLGFFILMNYKVISCNNMQTSHTSEVAGHEFIQAVELLSVFKPGAMWHSPVTGTGDDGRHCRWGRRRRAKKTNRANVKVQLETLNNLKYDTETASDYVMKDTAFKPVYRCNGQPYLTDHSDRPLFTPAGDTPSGRPENATSIHYLQTSPILAVL